MTLELHFSVAGYSGLLLFFRGITGYLHGFVSVYERPIMAGGRVWIAYSIVNGAGFKMLLSHFKPGYRLPSDRYFMGLIERQYVDVRESVKLRLQQETAFASITGDILTSIATHAYLTLTVHFLSSEWDMCSIVLGTKPLKDRHNGENITIWIEEMLATFSISTDNVSAFVHDSGSNIRLAGQLLHDKYGWYTEACAGHTL